MKQPGALRHLARESLRFGRDRVARRHRLPAHVDDIDAELLSELLGRPVDAIETLDATDGTTDRVRLALTGSDVPASVFVKMPPRAGALRFFNDLARLGRTEVGFYRDVRPGLEIEAPAVLGWAHDPATERYVLVLEDLAARGSTFLDTRVELGVEHASLAVDLLAGLHGAHWDSPRLRAGSGDLGWVSANGSDPLIPLVVRTLPSLARRLTKKDPSLMSDQGRTLLRHYREIARRLDDGPQTVLHGDPHPGNLYIEGERVGLLDWQAMRRGNGLRDVAYLLILALDADTRRTHQTELLDRYRAEVHLAGGPALEPAATWDTYRQMAAYTYVAAAFTAGFGRFQDEHIATAGLERATTAIDDLRTTEALGLT